MSYNGEILFSVKSCQDEHHKYEDLVFGECKDPSLPYGAAWDVQFAGPRCKVEAEMGHVAGLNNPNYRIVPQNEMGKKPKAT